MNILLIGNGAREHAVAEAFERSPKQPKLYAYMKASNPGITMLCEGVELGSYDDLDAMVAFAKKIKANFAFIGPEDPLNNGAADALEKAGIPCIGPRKALAKLETSKRFTRDLLKKHGIPGNIRFRSFTKSDISEAPAFLEELGEVVVKPDGLTGGKGVKVQGDHFQTKEEALAYAKEVLQSHPSVILEEKIEGEEFSLMAFTDGKCVVGMPAVQDHKRAYDNDEGPNTGGMGSYSCPDHLLPFLDAKDIEQALLITQKVSKALKEETGEDYIGIMYGGFMLTRDGVKLIEYNARFGDPEAMNVLPLLKTDFVELCLAMTQGQLYEVDVEFSKDATVCKYIVPEGYPDKPVKGEKIAIDEDTLARFYHASVEEKEDGIYMSSSRAVGVVGVAPTLEQAEKIAEDGCQNVTGRVFHRKDIGTQALIDKRVKHMERLRS